ncbi:Glycolate dehydrogenase, FAD-binding subunit GlcE [hydrothermal vent metagenome]|uniref:Glycolate dehydrogenase, FAD-binding subunit GlcE n=1 Tax=hydrothermal vent metagenome TaxID=652676 RepID=A0A3B0UDN3_9ZZZZ
MATTFKPAKPEDVLEVIAWAAAEHKPLEIVGGGTKRGIGRPAQTEYTLDMSGLTGISLYEPDELVLSAAAGTPVAEIKAALAQNGQELAFEPPDLGRFFGNADDATPPREATIGGVISANLSGPRRIRAGAARDHFLGLKLVTGRGQAIVSGGRVIKNVTGYDLCKGLAGSWGTLGALTEVTLKVLPAGETGATVLIFGLDAATAATAMSAALGSNAEISGAAHLLASAAARSKTTQVKNSGTSVTALRIEGFPASVKARRAGLEALLKHHGEIAVIKDTASRALWAEIRDGTLLPPLAKAKGKKEAKAGAEAKAGEEDDTVIWRISTRPTAGHRVVAAVAAEFGADAVFDWGGGLVWLAQPVMGNGNAAAIRTVLETTGGHATLYRGPQSLRAAIDVFQPQSGPLAALTRRLKAAFDPHGVLNPNRMYAGV